MRGRLVFTFMASLVRLDRATMIAASPGPGGLDPDFHEPVLVDRDGDGVRERVRVELPPVRVPCQVEPETMDELRMFDAGNSPASTLRLVMHFRDLERLGLVNTRTGEPLIGPGDRLEGIYDRRGELVQRVRTPPGLFVNEARPIGWGLDLVRPRRNLLLVTFGDRQQAFGRAW